MLRTPGLSPSGPRRCGGLTGTCSMNDRFPAVPPDVVDSGSTRRKNRYGRTTVSRKNVLSVLYVFVAHSMSSRILSDGDEPSHAALKPPELPPSGYWPSGP